MNSFKLTLEYVPNNLEIEGIRFSRICYIRLQIDDVDILNQYNFEGSFIVFDELRKSSKNVGYFLLFTSIIGVTDSAGWDKILVKHFEDVIIWEFKRDELAYKYKFDKSCYLSEVNKINENLLTMPKEYTLEPEYVIFPE